MENLNHIIESLMKRKYHETIRLLECNELNQEQRKLIKLLKELDRVVPYVSKEKEDALIELFVGFLKRYKKKSIKIKKHKVKPFNSLTDAMEFVNSKIEMEKTLEEKIAKAETKEFAEMIRDKKILTTNTPFIPLPNTVRISIVNSDIVILGNSNKLIEVFKDFNYKLDKLNQNQLVIRKVDILGIRKDILYIPSKDKTPLVKGKKHLALWEKNLIFKRSSMFHLLSEFRNMIEDRFDKHTIIEITKLKKDFYYHPILPKACIAYPYCQMVQGKLIKIFYDWDVL